MSFESVDFVVGILIGWSIAMWHWQWRPWLAQRGEQKEN